MVAATQKNTAFVEQGVGAAESLKSQAQRLVNAVCVFTLDARAATAAPMPA